MTNDSESKLLNILAVTFSLQIRKMEGSEITRLFAPLAVVGGLVMWAFIPHDERMYLLFWIVSFASYGIWSWYSYTQHKALARGIYCELRAAGYLVHRGGVYGPEFRILAIDQHNPNTDTDIEALLR
jgi:hypothetical protein